MSHKFIIPASILMMILTIAYVVVTMMFDVSYDTVQTLQTALAAIFSLYIFGTVVITAPKPAKGD